MKERISAALAAKYPTLKPYQARKSAARYVDVMLAEIADSIRRFGFADDQISLSLDKVSKKVGRMKVDGKDVKVCGAVNSDRENALVRVDFEGNEGKISRVSINPSYLAEIMLALAELHPLASDAADYGKPPNVHTPVDEKMLDSYIENTHQAMRDCQQAPSNKEKYQQVLIRNLLCARHIKALLIEEDGHCLFPEYWEQSDSGRCYGHGTSLQRVSKEVRHAALGRCHMYDFKAASYALMMDLALGIDPTLKVGVLKEYVKRRSHIRKAIASDVGISEDKMKTIFTSVGFGAKMANNPFASIRKTLGETGYNRLMINDQFSRIVCAMIMVRETICGYFPDTFEFLGRYYTSVCPRTGNKRTKDQKLAWLYQAMEANAITRFGADAAEAGYPPLLFVHDCVYFRHKLPERVLENITQDMQYTFPSLEADHGDIYPIHTSDFVDAVYAQENQEIKEHRNRMRQLEEHCTMPEDAVQPEATHSYDGLAHIMSASDIAALRKQLAGPYSLGVSFDVGRIRL